MQALRVLGLLLTLVALADSLSLSVEKQSLKYQKKAELAFEEEDSEEGDDDGKPKTSSIPINPSSSSLSSSGSSSKKYVPDPRNKGSSGDTKDAGIATSGILQSSIVSSGVTSHHSVDYTSRGTKISFGSSRKPFDSSMDGNGDGNSDSKGSGGFIASPFVFTRRSFDSSSGRFSSDANNDGKADAKGSYRFSTSLSWPSWLSNSFSDGNKDGYADSKGSQKFSSSPSSISTSSSKKEKKKEPPADPAAEPQDEEESDADHYERNDEPGSFEENEIVEDEPKAEMNDD